MNHLNSTQKKDIVSIILQSLPVTEAIFLYGSMARGEGRVDSDVDLAILHKEPLTAEIVFQLRGSLGSLLNRDVDILDCRRASLEMTFNAIVEAETLYEKNPHDVAIFENNIMSMYANFSIERRDIMESIVKAGSVYGS